ncbi:MAG TPA: aminopeptidase, partial [Anaerolineae bacterium]|nr:aminopeptidase [Anaerolineae bacterium]
MTTLFPTEGYAVEGGMSLRGYEDFVYRACHANEADPVAYWKSVHDEQVKMIERIQGRNLVSLNGPNVDLSLSIKGRKFNNSCGRHNMPDGEIYTGPVEESVNGWV